MNQSRREFLKISALTSLFLFGLTKGIKFDNLVKLLDDDEKICRRNFHYWLMQE